MRSSSITSWKSCAAWLALVVAGCSVDGRALTFEFHSLQGAGAGGTSGSAGEGGSTSLPDAGSAADAGESPIAGSGGDAGAAPAAGGNAENGDAGTGGKSAGGSANGGAPSAGAANGGSSGSPSPTGSAGLSSAGTGGAVFSGPCGDLNHDLVDDCSQTLVQNSRFDSNVNGWDAEPSLTETWNAANASGKSGSGSLSLNHTGDGGTMSGARQCIPVSTYTTYDVAARVQLASGQTGKAGVNVYLYDDDACQGNFVVGNTPIVGGNAGAWTDLMGTLWIPGNVHSMFVRLVAEKPLGQQALNVLIDDVLVTKQSHALLQTP